MIKLLTKDSKELTPVKHFKVVDHGPDHLEFNWRVALAELVRGLSPIIGFSSKLQSYNSKETKVVCEKDIDVVVDSSLSRHCHCSGGITNCVLTILSREAAS